MPLQYGVIGFSLEHSFSPQYFAEKFIREEIDASYEAYELEKLSEFPSFLKDKPLLSGLNVTIPYKQEILPYLDRLDDMAASIGAVNCIDIKGGQLIGYNTDAAGFEKSLVPLLQSHHTKALVLGTGGAAMAIKYVLNKLGIDFLSVSRERKEGVLAYTDVDMALIKEYLLVVNTSPLGMSPDIYSLPLLPYEAITGKHLLYDLVYNPEETAFLKSGKAQGATTKNGLEMLHIQAEESWKIWQGKVV
jgi:shikimate dehydrogenase